MPRLVVITGGPFSGKTTLVGALAGRGFASVPEAALDIITELNRRLGIEGQRRWRSSHLVEFQRRIFELQVEREEALGPVPGPVFLDRGIADGIAYCMKSSVTPPPEFRERALASGYEHAFVLDTLEGFTGREGTGRMSSAEDSLEVGRLLARVYSSLGVPVTRLAGVPVGERVEAVLEALGKAR